MIHRPIEQLENIAKVIRAHILTATTKAGSGHPTSSLSAVELMVALFFGGFFSYDLEDIQCPQNDRLIFSKGHAAPLLYALYAAAGAIRPEELLTLRKFNSRLEGHPTPAFPYTEVATGSLGQGLSAGVGMAIHSKYIAKTDYRTFVLLGDSEIAEGSVWEAIEIASHYKLNNLIGILDVSRLGQRGETLLGHDIQEHQKRIAAFGWHTILIEDGNAMPEVLNALTEAVSSDDKPVMMIARTIKGKGVSFLENEEGWHGRPLNEALCKKALEEIQAPDHLPTMPIAKPKTLTTDRQDHNTNIHPQETPSPIGEPIATRKAYGNALVRLFPEHPNLVVLDAETSNSTYAETFKKAYPDRFFEMFIAEQNMVGTALGLAKRGALPCVSTFAAFFTRAMDQIRMCQYSDAHIIFCGSHAGVSIGPDGISQMGLTDIALFRSILGSTVMYPSDAIATEKILGSLMEHTGVNYIRTTRADTPLLYTPEDSFPIGGSKTIRTSEQDTITVAAAGITVHEAIQAEEILAKEDIHIRVIDLYSIKPIDTETLLRAANETKHIIVVEDHYLDGGISEAVMRALSNHATPVHSLAVTKMPKSGTPEELLAYEEIDANAIVSKVRSLHI